MSSRPVTAWGTIAGVSVSHHRATVDELTAARGDSHQSRVQLLRDQSGVTEAFALQTCNRTEAYVVTDSAEQGQAVLGETVAAVPDRTVRTLDHWESVRHLMAVAAGLRSLVVGEDQVLGQFKDAYQAARTANGIGPVFEEAIPKAIHVGERVRSETSINDGRTTVGTAAIALADEHLTLDGITVLLVGAGEMGTLAARALTDYPISQLVIANRSQERADALAAELSADYDQITSIGLDALEAWLPDAALVLSTTGSDEPILTQSMFTAAGQTLVIDLAQPPDTTPAIAALADVKRFDLDALTAVTDRTTRERRAAAERVREIIDTELDHLQARYKRKRADALISGIYTKAERIKERELQQALSRLEARGDLPPAQQEAVESMADAIVSSLLADPTTELRDAAEAADNRTLRTAVDLFDPDLDGIGQQPPDLLADD